MQPKQTKITHLRQQRWFLPPLPAGSPLLPSGHRGRNSGGGGGSPADGSVGLDRATQWRRHARVQRGTGETTDQGIAPLGGLGVTRVWGGGACSGVAARSE